MLGFLYYPPPSNEVGGGYRNGFRPSVRHISFPELNYKSPSRYIYEIWFTYQASGELVPFDIYRLKKKTNIRFHGNKLD